MRTKKELSERYRLIQVSAPPDVADWWDSLPEGEKSSTFVEAVRKEMKKKEKKEKKVRT